MESNFLEKLDMSIELEEERLIKYSNPVMKVVEWVCLLLAIAGGFIFLFEAFMTVISVTGRAFFNKQIPGDYEIVQLVSAMAISMCLPYCQLRRGHVFVDFFTLWAPLKLKKILDMLAYILMALVSFLICWRVFEGMQDMIEYKETTMVLDLPVWWAYVPMFPSFFLLGIAALVTFGEDLRELIKQ